MRVTRTAVGMTVTRKDKGALLVATHQFDKECFLLLLPRLECGSTISAHSEITGAPHHVKLVGRLMLCEFLIDTGDNCLRFRNFQTTGKIFLVSPIQRQPWNRTPGDFWDPFPCSVRLCGHLLAGGGCFLGSVPRHPWSPGLSHWVKIQRCPVRILPTGQLRNTSISQDIRGSSKRAY
uniref:Uncharacterized protein n=1 Tax=Macaca nemestrina TaxID=9545 RepID=A0A2K6CII8_MACNE